MKKVLFIVLGILFTSVIVSAGDDEAFYKALQNCSSYSSSGSTTTDGAVATFKSQIKGWENDKCVYKEYVEYSGINSCTTCKLTQRQIDELVNVMRAYSTVQKYSDEQVDTSKLSNVEGNPVVKVWNKYLMDGSVCNIEFSK